MSYHRTSLRVCSDNESTKNITKHRKLTVNLKWILKLARMRYYIYILIVTNNFESNFVNARI